MSTAEANSSVVARIAQLPQERAELLRLLLARRAASHPTRGESDGGEQVEGRASSAQESLWLIDQHDGGSTAYLIPVAWRMRGVVDEIALESAFSTLGARHESLRTAFFEQNGELYQKVSRGFTPCWTVISLEHLAAEDREQRIRSEREEEARQPFDLSRGSLIRARLLRLGYEERILMITMHHLVADGWSCEILFRELGVLYEAMSSRSSSSLNPPDSRYLEFSRWEREWMTGAAFESGLEYWTKQLQDAPGEHALPREPQRLQASDYRGDTVAVMLDRELTARIRDLARANRMTPFMVLYAGCAILLSKLSGQQDIVMGTPVANRRRSEFESTVGLFVNTVALRMRVDDALSTAQLLRETRRVCLEAYANQEISFGSVVGALRHERRPGRHPIYQVTCQIDERDELALNISGLQIDHEPEVDTPAKFDLAFRFSEQSNGMLGQATFAVSLFDRVTVGRWLSYLVRIFNGMTLGGSHDRLGDLVIMPEFERLEVLGDFNATGSQYPKNQRIHELFQQLAARAPDCIAITQGNCAITYEELNRRANRVARVIHRRGLSSGDYVVVLMPRSIQALIVQLGILKAGCAYVPIDPRAPVERRLRLVKDSGARLGFYTAELTVDFGADGAGWLDCVSEGRQIDAQLDTNLTAEGTALSGAYLMYTSGSTGVPKAVIVPHRAIVRLVTNTQYVSIGPGDSLAHCSSPAFDASTFEIWGALLNGARVAVIDDHDVLDPHRFAAKLREGAVTVLWITVGLFSQYRGILSESLGNLRYVLTGGDVVDPKLARDILNRSRPAHLLNGYGPTECTTFSTTWEIEDVPEGAASIPIGQPISNTRVYVLDGCYKPVPIGVTGEIYIGGDGLALGYLNRPELTAEKFIADPAGKFAGARMYKTGDLGRWLSGGAVEFQGRRDGQVKIRGFRVELGEVEAALTRCPGVREAVVAIRPDQAGHKQIVGYVRAVDTSGQSLHLTPQQLRSQLTCALPEYMVPSAFVRLDEFPVNANGKVDRARLPAPQMDAYANRPYKPARGPIELKLAEIWKELLNVHRIGRDDDFFLLGGHSILVLRLLTRISSVFQTKLNITDVYRGSRLNDLADRIQGVASVVHYIDPKIEAHLPADIQRLISTPFRQPRVILLTGCTGFVGRFLLAQLIRDTDARVYCLVRSGDDHQGISRIEEGMERWELWSREAHRRVIGVAGDLRLPRLGINANTYEVLAEEVTEIYHCATSMNHLETYAMARSANVAGLEELLRLAVRSSPKTLNYVSTLSIFSQPEPGSTRVVSEDSSIELERHSADSGYTGSKWVAENVLQIARSRGIPCNVFRLGLVWADSLQGRYDLLQREHRIFITCLLSGVAIENYTYQTPPTPVDYVARAIAYLGGCHEEGGGVFHITSRTHSVAGLFERCNEIGGEALRLLSAYEWTCHIRELHLKGLSLPAVPLIEAGFSMDRESYYADQALNNCVRIEYDCDRTYRELEEGGIVAPTVDDELLLRYLRQTRMDAVVEKNPSRRRA